MKERPSEEETLEGAKHKRIKEEGSDQDQQV